MTLILPCFIFAAGTCLRVRGLGERVPALLGVWDSTGCEFAFPLCKIFCLLRYLFIRYLFIKGLRGMAWKCLSGISYLELFSLSQTFPTFVIINDLFLMWNWTIIKKGKVSIFPEWQSFHRTINSLNRVSTFLRVIITSQNYNQLGKNIYLYRSRDQLGQSIYPSQYHTQLGQSIQETITVRTKYQRFLEPYTVRVEQARYELTVGLIEEMREMGCL